MHCNITQATTVKGWVWVLRHTTPLTHIKIFYCLRGGGVPGAGTYVAPSFNHAGCVITTSGVFSFLFFWRNTWSTGHLILKLTWENTIANALLITDGVLFLPKGLWSLIRLTSRETKYMFLNLPRDVIRNSARFRHRVHTLRFETAT